MNDWYILCGMSGWYCDNSYNRDDWEDDDDDDDWDEDYDFEYDKYC